MLVKFHLHPTRAETDASPRRYLKNDSFFLKWPNHGTEFSARALKRPFGELVRDVSNSVKKMIFLCGTRETAPNM